MEYKNIFRFLNHLEHVAGTPIYCFQHDTFLYPVSDSARSGSALYHDHELLQTLLKQEGVYFEPEFDVFYVVHSFTDSFCCMLGPLALHSLLPTVQQCYSVRHSLPNKFISPVKRISQAKITAIMALIEDYFHQISVPHVLPFHLSENMFPSHIQETEHIVASEYSMDEFQDPFYKPSHGTYLLETKIQDALQSGNEKELFALLAESKELYSSNFALTETKQAEYSVVMLIVQFTRAAIDTGVPEPEAYALSDALLYETSGKKQMSEYQDLFYRACRQYLRLIQHYISVQNNIPLLNQCKSYICQNLNQPLSAASIAAALHVSKDYLLHLFSEYENTTLMEFVRIKRMDAIKNMLKYSDYDLLRIATYYNFKSQSHFSAVFRKYVGMSPSTYRKLHKPDAF